MDAKLRLIPIVLLCVTICVLIQSADLASAPSSPRPVNEKPCHDPLPVTNGGYTLWGENTLIEFYCTDGLFPLGPVFGSCDATSRRWSIKPPKCVAAGCPAPEAPAHGDVYLEFQDTKVTVLCQTGYKLYGSRVRYCNGTVWSGGTPRCRNRFEATDNRLQIRDTTSTISPGMAVEKDFKAAVLAADNSCYLVNTPPPDIDYGDRKMGYQYNTAKRQWVLVANYTCNHDYRLQDPLRNYLYCKSYSWHAKVRPVCVKDTKTPEVVSPCKTNNGGCEHQCVPYGGRMYKCECLEGYVLNRFGRQCDDVDECSLYNGHCEQDCHNTPGAYFCACKEGYVTSGTRCLDIDECAAPDTNLCPGLCINTPGSYACDCNITGYQPGESDILCQDVDECDDNNGGCEDICRNSHGSYSCHCRQRGFKLSNDRHNCTDVDECARYKKKVCSPGSCTNTWGSFVCSCDVGYVTNGRKTKCLDVNECKTNNGGCEDVCKNIPGGLVCLCEHPGYTLSTTDNSSCTDVDECAHDNGGCEDACVNTAGSYHCVCKDLLMVLATDNRTCTYCSDAEYTDSESGRCESCPQNSHTDGLKATTLSDCQCDLGFEHRNTSDYTCTDIDECMTGVLYCEFGCENIPGSAACYCPAGYNLTHNNTCQDIDECSVTETDVCNQTCNNVPGGYNCSCNKGYLLSADGYSCDDIDECYEGLKNCSHICFNTYGGAECQCPPGYGLHGDICLDIDECEAGIHVCEDRCNNTEGSYICDCTDLGYKLSWDLASCVDINECMEGENGCEEECENTVGSYTCTCTTAGFVIDPNNTDTCIDTDECLSDSTNICKQLCINTPGSFHCDCDPGYTLYSSSNCAPCPQNYYRTAEVPECVRCPRYAVTDKTAATSISDCRCHRSYMGNLTAGEQCVRRT